MKTSSKTLLVLGIAVIAVVAVIVFLISNLDAIVKAAIEKYGSRATGTEVTVSSVRISLKAGEGSISGLSIGNPPGFSTSSAFALEDITVAIDTGSVTKDPVVIEKIRISAPHVTYEINESGKANVNEIKKRLAGPGPADKPPEQEKAGNGKKLLIKDIVVEGGKVDVSVAALPGKPFSADLPRIRLSNVGGKGGATPAALAVQVLRPLMDSAVQAAAGTGVRQYLGKSAEDVKKMLEEGAKEKLGNAGEEAAKEAEGALKKLLGK